jgi:hypothetical protein
LEAPPSGVGGLFLASRPRTPVKNKKKSSGLAVQAGLNPKAKVIKVRWLLEKLINHSLNKFTSKQYFPK